MQSYRYVKFYKARVVETNIRHAVWQVTYKSIHGEITELSRTPANESVAGISLLTSLPSPNFLEFGFSKALQESSVLISSVDEFIKAYSRGISRALTLPLAAQTSPRPAISVQKRVPKLVTKLPVSALWTLVASNFLFALLGIGLSALALFSMNTKVYQVQTRLGIEGLVAERFEGRFSEGAVKSASGLFEECTDYGKKKVDSDSMVDTSLEICKRVGVKETEAGGSVFFLSNEEKSLSMASLEEI